MKNLGVFYNRLKKKNYLFICLKELQREVSYPLGHSLDGYNSQGLTKPKARARDFFQVSSMVAGAQTFAPSSAFFRLLTISRIGSRAART